MSRAGALSPGPERSYCSSRLATVQPLFNSPTRSSFLAMALSKKVSQNGEEPEISRMGFMVTPGCFISSNTKLMPSCLGASGSVLTRQNIQSAWSAPEVQTFWPLMTK